MDKLRLRFKKTGRAIYISHLDLMHTMQRAFSRAGYELKYSEGFNPHPQISIALPLSVGASSLCEIMDFRLKSDADLSELPVRLNEVLPEGLEVIEAYEQSRKVAELKWLEVEGRFEYDDRDLETMCEELQKFYSMENIIISKKTKRGMGEMNICPGIQEISFAVEKDVVKVKAVISAQEPTINPELLAEALRQLNAEIAPDFAAFIRVECYDREFKIYR